MMAAMIGSIISLLRILLSSDDKHSQVVCENEANKCNDLAGDFTSRSTMYSECHNSQLRKFIAMS